MPVGPGVIGRHWSSLVVIGCHRQSLAVIGFQTHRLGRGGDDRAEMGRGGDDGHLAYGTPGLLGIEFVSFRFRAEKL